LVALTNRGHQVGILSEHGLASSRGMRGEGRVDTTLPPPASVGAGAADHRASLASGRTTRMHDGLAFCCRNLYSPRRAAGHDVRSPLLPGTHRCSPIKLAPLVRREERRGAGAAPPPRPPPARPPAARRPPPAPRPGAPPPRG